ncbi:MAG: PHB depolymerase family esterase [Polyangiaceae bacterium]
MSLSPRRRKTLYVAVGTISTLLVLGACAMFRGPTFAGARGVTQSLSHGGRARSYELYRPASLTPQSQPGLILALHGAGGTGRGMEGLTLGKLNRIADRDGYIVVYPDGVNKRWNDLRPRDDNHVDTSVDDIGFLIALIDELSARFNIDPSRVYVTGASNGGFMSFALVCASPDRFAAFAPVMAGIGTLVAEHCALSTPRAPAVSLLMINGTRDPLVPYDGTSVTFRERHLGNKLTVPATISTWASWLGCPSAPTTTTLPNTDPDDGTWVTQTNHVGCRDQSEISLITVDGGGHTWPGGHPYLPERTIGKTSRDVDASELIAAFFSRHRRSRSPSAAP